MKLRYLTSVISYQKCEVVVPQYGSQIRFIVFPLQGKAESEM